MYCWGGVTRHANDTHTATPCVCSSQHTHGPSSSPTFTSLLPVLSTPRHATHAQPTHALRSSRTLSTHCLFLTSLTLPVCSSQTGHVTQLAPHKLHFPVCSSQTGHVTQLAPHKLHFHCLLLTDRPCYTACSSQAHVHTHTYNFTHSTTSNTTSPPTQLPLSSTVHTSPNSLNSAPRLREPLEIKLYLL